MPSLPPSGTMPRMIPSPLLAVAGAGNEAKLVVVLGQLAIIVVAARLAAAGARKLGQPAVVGEILAGLILGPSVLGHVPAVHKLFHPELFHPAMPQVDADQIREVFTVLSQLGLIFLLFLIGLEFDFAHLRTTRGASLTISAAGVVAPFVLGVGLGLVMFPHVFADVIPTLSVDEQWHKRVGFVLFMGTAMSITAIPILGRIMMEMGINRTKLGAVTITAAAADDAAGWVLLATVSALVGSGFRWQGTVVMLAEVAAFAGAMVFVAGPVLRSLARRATAAGSLSLNALAGLLVVLFGCAIATSQIGIFAIFGAFLLGAVLSGEATFRRAVGERLRDFVTAFFLPIFFTYTGLRTNVGSVGGPLMWAFAAAVVVLAVAGKFGGCAVAARWSGMTGRESVLIGIMMNTRALMELIVVNVGRDLGVIPDGVFCMLVIMAVATTVTTAPVLLWGVRGTDLEPLVRGSGFLRPARRAA